LDLCSMMVPPSGSVTFWGRSGSLNPYTWLPVPVRSVSVTFKMRIWSRIMFLGLPDPDSLVRDTDQDPSITKQK
jgi:hypothetical protein